MTAEGAEGGGAAGDAGEGEATVNRPLPAAPAASAKTAAAAQQQQQQKKNNTYTVAQQQWAVEVYNSAAGKKSATATARHLAMMAPSEFRHVTNTNVRSWVEASERGSLGGKHKRSGFIAEPCLRAMRAAAEAAIASGQCIGSRMLRQIFLAVARAVPARRQGRLASAGVVASVVARLPSAHAAARRGAWRRGRLPPACCMMTSPRTQLR
jgi:hypothetical protein